MALTHGLDLGAGTGAFGRAAREGEACEVVAVARDAVDRLGANPPDLVRSMITLSWSGRSR